MPLMVCGDFNCILSQEENRGSKPFKHSLAANEMEEFMATNDLVDHSFIGPAFIWSKLKSTEFFSRYAN
ncbi:hypothetical protein MA16_Dca021798 [Dendrobium catenatum]|uniref:Uncharacterized protein n=1 Tax=Dendrobium catenatum TaxID=906689 RepID=A0A2I0WXX2_9ASPA|nr:hypothetical protein MA16_Dca021798 [Dendrobium catenatum]